jgi:hypothetical protein
MLIFLVIFLGIFLHVATFLTWKKAEKDLDIILFASVFTFICLYFDIRLIQILYLKGV